MQSQTPQIIPASVYQHPNRRYLNENASSIARAIGKWWAKLCWSEAKYNEIYGSLDTVASGTQKKV